MPVWEEVEKAAVAAVLVVDEVDAAVPLAHALLDGGITAMELTLRTPAAVAALKAIRTKVPEMLAGVGTILTPEQVVQASEAGAAFGVAPGQNPRVVRAAKETDLPFAPGVATPSELELAIELGCRNVKFFPAEAQGGLPYLRSMMAPYKHLGIRTIPLGGLNLDNFEEYLADDNVLAIGGSWIAPRALIQAQDWPAIRHNAENVRKRIDGLKREQQ